MRKKFYDLLLEMTADQDGMITTEINTDYNTGVIKVFDFFVAVLFPLLFVLKLIEGNLNLYEIEVNIEYNK